MSDKHLCEFADGPLQGLLDLQIPIEEAPSTLQFPITKDLSPYKGEGLPAGYVEYQKRGDNESWKYFHTKTDLSREAAEAALNQIKSHKAASELSNYSLEQLVYELASRDTFVGVIVYTLDEITTDNIPTGSKITVASSKFFASPLASAKMLQFGLDLLKQHSQPKKDAHPVFEVDGIKTLPLYHLRGRTLENIGAFDKGKVRLEYVDPIYVPPDYQLDLVGESISNDFMAAIKAVEAWGHHIANFVYFVQFKDDKSRKLIRSLNEHTELVTTLCDARLGLDSKDIWESFDSLVGFEAVHADYRADPNREIHYSEYAEKLDRAYSRYSAHSFSTKRLIDRMMKQIQLKSAHWKNLPPIVIPKEQQSETIKPSTTNTFPVTQLKLFYSYSHNDENLRVELEKHLRMLERNGVIKSWHFRKIPPGREWEGEIDENLEDAHIILLLISADFLNSNYCWEVEARRAMERHQKKSALVIPIVLRACDWENSPFKKLEALPTGTLPVTSWSNMDEALTDVAKGIRRAAEAIGRRE